MKAKFLVLVLVLSALGMPCFAGAVHLTGSLSADFLGDTSTQQIINTFAVGDQPLFWGPGWEVILDRAGFGGDYQVSFWQDADTQWWLDWYAPALFLSFHPFGGTAFLDPFLAVGIGTAGRVALSPRGMGMGHMNPGFQDLPYLSIFPFAAAGLSLNLDGLLIGAKFTYTPAQLPVPTGLPPYPLGKFQDKYLFTTDVHADLSWVISTFSRRWSIEVAFKSSKQVMKIQSPQHWCRQSVEKLSPWVWLMQSVISLWYFTEGRKLPAAQAARRRFGEWDTEWSLAHMLRILRTAILEATINPESATKADLCQLLNDLENYLNLAA